MSALVLHSKNAISPLVQSIDFLTYKNRVLKDGGQIVNELEVKEAFSFLTANDISLSEVYSATSASWGVKVKDGKPARLYSLSGENGDIVFDIPSPTTINYDTTNYGKPVIEFKASRMNQVRTVQPVDNVHSSVVCVASKAPMLATGQSYGGAPGLTKGTLFYPDYVADSSKIAESRVNSVFYYRLATTTADNWQLRNYAHGTASILIIQPEVAKAQEWGREAAFVSESKADFYNDGVLFDTRPYNASSGYKDGLVFELGRMRNGSKQEPTYESGLYGGIAEAWCLVNTTTDAAKALSKRIAEKY